MKNELKKKTASTRFLNIQPAEFTEAGVMRCGETIMGYIIPVDTAPKGIWFFNRTTFQLFLRTTGMVQKTFSQIFQMHKKRIVFGCAEKVVEFLIKVAFAC